MGLSLTIDERQRAYMLACQPPEHEELRRLREVTATMAKARLQIAPEQGHLLAFLVRLIGARRVLELGTFTGYSALAMALTLPPGGHLVTCDVDAEWAAIGRAHWDRAGVGGKIEQCLGPAIETLAELCKTQPGTFDLIFIDADKGNYGSYYEAALVLVRLGGLIALDNMLFRGLVADPQDNDARALPVRALNEKIKADARVEHVLLPVGDGMTIARRRA